MSYKSKVCALRGTTDEAAVTLRERIDACVKEQCAKTLRGDITRAAYINSNQFNDEQLTELSLRGIRGNMTDLMIPVFTADSSVDTDGNAVTDAQLDTVYIYVVFMFAKLIGTGAL